MRRSTLVLAVLAVLAALPAPAQQNLLTNPGFEDSGAKGIPAGWSRYGGDVPESRLAVETEAHGGKAAVHMWDTGPNERDNKYAVGLSQDVAVTPGRFYLGSIWAKGLARNHEQAVVVQLTFLPSNKSYSRYVTPPLGGGWARYSVGGEAPEDAKTCRFYIYTMHFWTSETLVDDAALAVLDRGSGGMSASLWAWGHEPLAAARPLKLRTPLAAEARPAAVIACPAEPAWKQVAMDLQLGIQRQTGVTLMLHTDLEPLLRSDQTILALGNMNNNFVLERLYFNSYTKADSLYPGPGNFALRTVHQPFNFGDINVLSIEASDLAGARAGVTELLRRLPEGGNCALDKPLLYVSTTKPASAEGAQKIVEAPVSQDLLRDFWSAAQQYRDTGEIAWAQRARRVMILCEERLAAEPQYHITWPEETTSDQLGPAWDVIEEAPVWSDEERLQATNCLFSTMLGMPRLVSWWGSFKDNDTILFNHSTFPLTGIFFIDRYLSRYYPGHDPVFDEYMAQVVGAFRGQVKSFKPQCDADGYLTIVPRHTIEYTLAQNDYTFFENGQARLFAEYLTAWSDNLGQVPGFGDSGLGKGPGYENVGLPLAFWYYKDPRYLWRLQQVYGGKWLNPYDTTIQPLPWKQLAGASAWALSPEFYRWLSSPASGNEKTTVALEQGFDKLTFREKYEGDCQWLLLDGIAGGRHLHYDGNAIVKYRGGGEDWLVDGDYLVRNTTEHNMVSVIKDGRADRIEPPLTRLDALADLPTCAFSRTTVPDYNGVDWSRNLLWLKGLGFVVADEMVANEAADYTFESIFKTQDIGVGRLAGRVYSLTRPTDGGNGTRGLTPLSNYLPDVPRAVRFGDTGARLQFPVTLPAGTYAVTLYAQGRDSGSDSLWLSVDGGENVAFHIPFDKFGPSADAWTKDTPTPKVTVAPGGVHIFRITLRENPGAVLQKIVIATPEGKELQTIEASNPPVLDPALVKPAPDARFYIKGDGLAASVLTARTNNVNLEFRYLHQVTGGHLGRRQSALLGNLFYNDRSDAPVDLDLRRAGDDTLVVLRGGKPWGVLSWVRERRSAAPGAPLAAWLTGDTVAAVDLRSLGSALRADKPVSLEVDLKRGTATVYARAATVLTLDGRQQTVPAGQSSLNLGKSGALDVLREEARKLRAAALARTVEPGAGAAGQTLAPAAKPAWTVPATSDDDRPAVINRLVPADVNADGVEELLVGRGRSCVCLDAAGKQLWALETGARVNDACLADINGDGKDEVLIGSDDECFYLTDAAGKLLSKTHCDAPLRVGRSSVRDPRVSNVAAGDVDADGKLDVIIGTRNGNLCRYDTALKMLWRFDEIEHGTYRLRLLDLNGDGKLEIVAANRYGSVEVVSATGKALPNAYSELGDVVFDVGDLNGDGKPEIVNGSSTGALTCTPYGEKVAWRFDNFGYGAKEVRIADLDGDGKLETALASETGYVYLLDAEGQAKARRYLGAAVLSLAVLGEGAQTRLAAGCRDGMAYVLDGTLKPLSSLRLPGPVTYLAVQKGAGGQQQLIAAGGDALAAVR